MIFNLSFPQRSGKYQWRKYKTKYVQVESPVSGSSAVTLYTGNGSPVDVTLGDSVSLNPTTGRFSLGGDLDYDTIEYVSGHSYGYWRYIYADLNDKLVYYNSNKNLNVQYERDYRVTVEGESGDTCRRITSKLGKGNFIENVYSENPDAYPEDGEQDGFWYDSKEYVTSI